MTRTRVFNELCTGVLQSWTFRQMSRWTTPLARAVAAEDQCSAVSFDDFAAMEKPNARPSTFGARVFVEERFGPVGLEPARVVAKLQLYAQPSAGVARLHDDSASGDGCTGVESLASVLQKIAEHLDHPCAVDAQFRQVGGDVSLDLDGTLLEPSRLDRQGVLGDHPERDRSRPPCTDCRA